MVDTPIISVIVPFKNAEPFLPSLFLSLKEQTFVRFEVIAVDDHSTDAGVQLWREQMDDCRFSCISSSGYGPSAARNAGLQHAKGQYVFFADADDTIPPAALEMLYNAASKSNAEMVVGDFSIITADDDRRKNSWFAPVSRLLDRQGVCALLAEYLHKPRGCAEPVNVWGKLYSREVLEKFAVVFDESLETWEDTVFNLEYMKVISSFYYLHEKVYNYHIHSNVSSGGSKVFFAPLGFRRVLDIIRDILEENMAPEILKQEYERGAVYSAVRLLMLYYNAFRNGKAPVQVDRVYLKQLIKTVMKDEAVGAGLRHYKVEPGESRILPFLLKLRSALLIDWWCWKKTGVKKNV